MEFKSLHKIERLVATDQMSLISYEREGERLAEKGLPEKSASELTAFEKNEIKQHQDAIDELMRERDKLVRSATDEKADLQRKISSELPAEIKSAEDNFKGEMEKSDAEMGPKSAVFDSTSIRYAEVTSDLKLVKNSLNNRELQTSFVKTYVPFMLALAFAEVWVNRLAFELFFESNPLVSLFLAIAVGLMLVFFAHIVGASVKRILPKEVPHSKTNTIISMVLLNSLVAVFILYLAKMRQAFVSINNSQGLSLEGVFDTGEIDGLEGVIGELDGMDALISTNLGEEGFFLLLVNIVVYVAGVIAAMLRHDSHPDYEKLTKLSEKLGEKKVSLKKKYETKIAELQKQKSDKINSLQKELSDSENRLEKLESDLAKLDKVYKSSGAAVAKALKAKIKAFRDKNSEIRSDKAPSYFSKKVELEV